MKTTVLTYIWFVYALLLGATGDSFGMSSHESLFLSFQNPLEISSDNAYTTPIENEVANLLLDVETTSFLIEIEEEEVVEKSRKKGNVVCKYCYKAITSSVFKHNQPNVVYPTLLTTIQSKQISLSKYLLFQVFRI